MAEKNKGGRPRFEPTEQQRKTVKALAAYGIAQRDIATVIEVSEPTLRTYFWRELETGGTEANAKVAENLFRKATSDGAQSVTAAIFWMKARAGWRDQEAPAGKKAEASAAAAEAGKGSGWGDDLAFPGDSIN